MKRKMLLLTLAAMLFGWCGAMAQIPDDTLWTKEIFSEYIVAAGFTPDGSQVIAVAHSGLLFFDAETGEFIRKFDKPYKDYGIIYNAKLSTLHPRFFDNNGIFWDYELGDTVYSVNHSVAIADKKNVFYSRKGQAINSYDYETGEFIESKYNEKIHKDGYSRFTPSDDGRYIFLSRVKEIGETDMIEQLYDWDKNELFEISIKTNFGSNIASFSPDGRYMATGGEDGTVTIYDLNQDIVLDNEKKGKKMVKKIDHQINANTHHIRDLSFSNDSKYLYTLGGRINHKQIWVIDMLDFSVFYKYPDPFGNGLDLAIDPSNKKIVVGGFNYLFLLNNKAHTSIEDQYFESILYPNPTSNIVNIEFENKHASNVNISIYNESGVMIDNIISQTMETGEQTISYDCTNLPIGTYFCVIKTGNNSRIAKFVVVR